MRQVSFEDADRWVHREGWLRFPDDGNWRFDIQESQGLTRYQWEISEDRASVGAAMSDLLLVDFTSRPFDGGLVWVQRIIGTEANAERFMSMVFRGCGVHSVEWKRPMFFIFDATDLEAFNAIVALAVMFSWDANFVTAGHRMLIECDDEPILAVVALSTDERLKSIGTSYSAKVTEPGNCKSRGVPSP